ncbi:MAG: flavodoxin domain-containing protein [Anaeroplasmataceae bacterium]|nr:flavodoxin domain-containing protein [Anaeroplasmataceae bacterium]
MVEAVVYSSKCGHSYKYACALAEKLEVPLLKISHAKKKLKKGTSILYISWVKEDIIVGYDKMSKFQIDVLCAVGILPKCEDTYARLREKNVLYSKFFYLRGGIDRTKLGLRHRIALKSIENNLSFKLLDSGLSKAEASALDAILHDLNYTNLDDLNEIFTYLKVNEEQENLVS